MEIMVQKRKEKKRYIITKIILMMQEQKMRHRLLSHLVHRKK